VIAHAGAYGCDHNEMEKDVIPVLKKLMKNHSNLMIDISGLKFEHLLSTLKSFDPKRILFGSDALYYDQWATMLKLAHAVKTLKMNIEDTLAQIISINPSKNIFDRIVDV